MDDQEQDIERKRANRNGAAVQARSSGTPGRSTLTGRMPASAASIARAVVTQLRANGAEQAAGDVHALAAHGLSGSGGSVPHLDVIQKSFGHHDISGVQAHVGGRAEEASAGMGAHAYASGNQVAFARSPDVHLAAHELAHVVQQRGGVRLAGGVGREGDQYERHADAVADLVVQGKSAEGLLDTMAHRGSTGGSALQHRMINARDTAASARALFDAIPHATSEEAATIASRLEQSASHPRLVDADIPLSVQCGPDHLNVHIAYADAARLVQRAHEQEIAAARTPVCRADAPRVVGGAGAHIPVTQRGFGLIDAMAGGIALCAGQEGDQQLLTFDLSLPAGSGIGVVSAIIRLRVGHSRARAGEEGAHGEAAGFDVAGTFEFGGGVEIPGGLRARLMAGVTVSGHGRDPHQAAEMIALALQHGVHEISPVVEQEVFGAGSERTRIDGMEEGESAEASASLRGEIHAGSEAEHASVDISLGASTHSRVERDEHGVHESTYTAVDLSTRMQFMGFECGIEAHLPADPGSRPPQIIARMGGHMHAEGSEVVLASLISHLLGLLSTAMQQPGGEEGRAHVDAGLLAVGAISNGAQTALLAQAPHGEVGVELEIELGAENVWILKTVEHIEHTIEVPGLPSQRMAYENLHEIMRGPIGGPRHERARHAPAPVADAPMSYASGSEPMSVAP